MKLKRIFGKKNKKKQQKEKSHTKSKNDKK